MSIRKMKRSDTELADVARTYAGKEAGADNENKSRMGRIQLAVLTTFTGEAERARKITFGTILSKDFDLT